MRGGVNPFRETNRDRAKAETRAKVLAAGRAMFEEVGYEAATIRAIAAACEMSTGAVFASFRDKADLYRAVYGRPPVDPHIGAQLLEIAKQLRLAPPGGFVGVPADKLDTLIAQAGG